MLRRLSPAAAPVSASALVHGAAGLARPRRAIARLEHDLAQALAVRHVRLFSSGRAALTVILLTLRRLSPKTRVIVPAYNCFSVPAAIVRAGLEVVPCDIDPVTFDFDYGRLDAAIAATDPLCVIPTHMFGIPANIARVRTLCQSRGVFIVEDAAQALGTTTRDGSLGTLGDIGFFSFGRGKAVTSGSGGAVVTNRDDLAAELAREYETIDESGATHGLKALVEAAVMAIFLRPSLYWLPASLPFLHLGETVYDTSFSVRRLSGAQAGLLEGWRLRLAAMNEARITRVTALARVAPGRAPARTAPFIRLPVVCTSRSERDRVYAASEQAGLGVSLMYPTAITAIPELHGHMTDTRCPQAENVADRLLTIPVHPFVSARDCERLKELFAQNASSEAGAA